MMAIPKPQEPEPVIEAEPAPAVESDWVAEPAAPVAILRLSLGDGGPPLEAWVPETATLAVACTWLHGALLPMSTALDGRLVASWRLGNQAGPLAGWCRVQDLEQPLVLHRVESTLRALAIRLDGIPDVVHLKVASVVQLGAVIEQIARHKGVDLSGSSIYSGDQAYPHEALVDELPDVELVLKA
jgi:hypothetical protein